MAKVLEYKGGNLLAYAEHGDRSGYPVLVQHGMIASIRDVHLFDRLAEAGVRLVFAARPGYGESTPYRMRNLAEWGEIVAVLVETLNLSQFDVLGISSGAPYSYAIGCKLPDRARNIYILSGTPALYDDEIRARWPYPTNSNASIVELQALARELFFSGLLDDDKVRNDVRDSMANDCFGIAQDLRLRCRGWGFHLSDVKQRVYMQHSRLDHQVPFVTAEMTSRLLPNCRFEVREDGEHFSRQVLNEFVEKMILAQYKR